jgi:hypothetical protein
MRKKDLLETLVDVLKETIEEYSSHPDADTQSFAIDALCEVVQSMGRCDGNDCVGCPLMNPKK